MKTQIINNFEGNSPGILIDGEPYSAKQAEREMEGKEMGHDTQRELLQKIESLRTVEERKFDHSGGTDKTAARNVKRLEKAYGEICDLEM